jgi:microcystin-dependent protein
MSDPFIGEIRLFPYTFPPYGWYYCDGSLVGIPQNQGLYAVIGTSYGGNGTSNFALPDLRSRVAVGAGNDPSDLFHPPFATNGGAESVTLTSGTIPSHTHTLNAAITPGASRVAQPGGNYITVLTSKPGVTFINENSFTSSTQPVSPVYMNPNTLSPFNGGSAAHENRQPYQALAYCICWEGVFPVRS